jgi:membrane fusion protein, heavy metal efflux system
MTSDTRPSVTSGNRRISRRVQFVIALTLVISVGGGISPFILRPRADQPENARPAKSDTRAGAFKPTKPQWMGLKFQPVTRMDFRPERATEGTIAIDDDLTTPVFSPYSGRVVRVIAKLGDVVEPGAPLFVIHASEFVQAQNDLITALANLTAARSQLIMAQTTEKRAHELYLAKGGALKDWQQAQTDLITAQNTVRADEIALHAVRSRLRILGKSDKEIASLEVEPTQKLDPVATVSAPIGGTITQRQVGAGQYINSEANGAANPVFTISNLSTVYLMANVRELDAPLMHVGLPLETHALAYPDRVFTGKISWVAPSIDPNTRRLPVRADIENPDHALKPGMFANFSIITGEASTAPAVPQEAIIYEGEHARVWVAVAGDSLALREIRIGRTSNGLVEVLAGLSAGEKVVTSGTVFIDRAAKAD